MTTPEHFESHALDAPSCWELLEQAELGRLAVIQNGYPEIFPVNYVVDGRHVVIETTRGTKYESAVRGPVCFEVDGLDRAAGNAWSVVITGTCTVVRDPDRSAALRSQLHSWHEGRKPYLLQVEPEWVTGRRFPVRTDLELLEPGREGCVAR